jgi:hypothetical protein
MPSRRAASARLRRSPLSLKKRPEKDMKGSPHENDLYLFALTVPAGASGGAEAKIQFDRGCRDVAACPRAGGSAPKSTEPHWAANGVCSGEGLNSERMPPSRLCLGGPPTNADR